MAARRAKSRKYAAALNLPNITITEVGEGGVIKIPETWNWSSFEDRKVVLELGCGKGEYSIALAQQDKSGFYIGVDIKSDRLYVGAKHAIDQNLNNVEFLRARIELIDKLFDKNSISEIWITFPDPHPTKGGIKHRLTNNRYLELYKKILKPNGIIHLKTDSVGLYEYSLDEIKEGGYNLICSTDNLYDSEIKNSNARSISSTFEQKFLPIVKTIKYLEFSF